MWTLPVLVPSVIIDYYALLQQMLRLKTCSAMYSILILVRFVFLLMSWCLQFADDELSIDKKKYI